MHSTIGNGIFNRQCVHISLAYMNISYTASEIFVFSLKFVFDFRKICIYLN